MKAVEVKGGGGEGDKGREAGDMAVIVAVEIEKREKIGENKTTGVVRMKKDFGTEMERDMLTEPVREGIGMKGMISPTWRWMDDYIEIGHGFGQLLGIEFRVCNVSPQDGK